MSFTPTPGQVAVAKLSATGGTADTILPGINWKIEADGKVYDVSNFRDLRSRVATLTDSTVTVTLIWDAGEQPTKAATTGIRLGVKGAIKCYVDATHFFLIEIIVSNMGPENQGVENVVQMDVTLQQSGTFTYPTDP
jgi:hypothetical protein